MRVYSLGERIFAARPGDPEWFCSAVVTAQIEHKVFAVFDDGEAQWILKSDVYPFSHLEGLPAEVFRDEAKGFIPCTISAWAGHAIFVEMHGNEFEWTIASLIRCNRHELYKLKFRAKTEGPELTDTKLEGTWRIAFHITQFGEVEPPGEHGETHIRFSETEMIGIETIVGSEEPPVAKKYTVVENEIFDPTFQRGLIESFEGKEVDLIWFELERNMLNLRWGPSYKKGAKRPKWDASEITFGHFLIREEKEVEQAAPPKLKPKVKKKPRADETLGKLTWNSEYDIWEGAVKRGNGEIRLSVSSTEDDENAISRLKQAFAWVETNEKMVKTSVANELLDDYNEEWRELSELPKLSSTKFRAELVLESISVYDHEHLEVRYDCNELFAGHGILVRVDGSEVSEVGLEG